MSESSSFDLSLELENLLLGNDTTQQIKEQDVTVPIVSPSGSSRNDNNISYNSSKIYQSELNTFDQSRISLRDPEKVAGLKSKLKRINQDLVNLQVEIKGLDTPIKPTSSLGQKSNSKDAVKIDRDEIRILIKQEIKKYMDTELQPLISKILKEEYSITKHQQHEPSLKHQDLKSKSPRKEEFGASGNSNSNTRKSALKQSIQRKEATPKLKKIQLEDYQTEILLRKLDEKFKAKLQRKRPVFK